MRFLLDTHIILWAMTGDKLLPQRASDIISNGENEIFFSVASMWEVTIKNSRHPDKMIFNGKIFDDKCRQMGFLPLDIKRSHVFMLETLKRPDDAPPHNDPFDRIMLAQAKAENMMFVTHDSLFPPYGEKCVIEV